MNQENDLVPCYCPKCKGCPRAKRTARRHRVAAASETARTANQPADVPDFADWRNSMLTEYATKSHVSGEQSRNMADDRDGSSSESEMSSGSKGDRERPLKRRRVEMDQVYNPFY